MYRSGVRGIEPFITVLASSPNKARALIKNNKKALEDCFSVIASLPNGTKKEKRGNGRDRFRRDFGLIRKRL